MEGNQPTWFAVDRRDESMRARFGEELAAL
jgi:hypothetical protein